MINTEAIRIVGNKVQSMARAVQIRLLYERDTFRAQVLHPDDVSQASALSIRDGSRKEYYGFKKEHVTYCFDPLGKLRDRQVTPASSIV